MLQYNVDSASNCLLLLEQQKKPHLNMAKDMTGDSNFLDEKHSGVWLPMGPIQFDS